MAYPVETAVTADALTTGTTVTLPIIQDKLKIQNLGTKDVSVAFGGITVYVHPGDTQEWVLQYTSFVMTGLGATVSVAYTATETGNDIIQRSEYVTAHIKPVVAVADADATLTAAQLVANSIFTQTPTAGRTLTTATGALIIAALPSYSVGSCFEFTVLNLVGAANAITLAAGATGVTLSGLATIAATTSGTFIGHIDSASAVTIYRK